MRSEVHQLNYFEDTDDPYRKIKNTSLGEQINTLRQMNSSCGASTSWTKIKLGDYFMELEWYETNFSLKTKSKLNDTTFQQRQGKSNIYHKSQKTMSLKIPRGSVPPLIRENIILKTCMYQIWSYHTNDLT